MDKEERNEVTTLYKIRWWIIFLIGFVAILSRILRCSFGVVNDVFAAYFNVTYETVDWFTQIQFPGIAISSIVLFVMLFGKAISSTKLALIMSSLLAFCSVFLIIAYVHTNLYPLIFVGEFILGITITALDPVTASYALSWFPEHQVGVALSAKEIGCNVGSLLGFIIPSKLLLVPHQIDSNGVPTNSTLETSQKQNWFAIDQMRLTVFSSVLLTIEVLITLSFAKFMSDQPPLPPTIAQEKVRRGVQQDTRFASNAKRLLFEVVLTKTFMQVIFIYLCTVGSCNAFTRAFMAEVLRELFEELNKNSSYNLLSGLVLMGYEGGCILGSVLSGKVIGRFKNYHQQVSTVLALLLTSMISLILGYYFKSIVVVCVFNFLLGVFVGYLAIPLYEIVFQNFFPMDISILAIMIRILFAFGILLLGETPRIVLNFFPGGISVLIYMSILLTLSKLLPF